MKRLFLLIVFAVGSLLVFSGQQRYAPPRSVRSSARPTTVESPPKESLPPPLPLVALRPDEMVWPQPGQGDRSTAPRIITLLGDPRSDGLYVVRTLIPKGKQVVPHVHSDSRSVVVISGTYYFALGKTFDASQLRAFPPGSFLTEPAGMPHYSWALDDEVILQTTAVGPSSTRVLPDEKPTGSESERQ